MQFYFKIENDSARNAYQIDDIFIRQRVFYLLTFLWFYDQKEIFISDG